MIWMIESCTEASLTLRLESAYWQVVRSNFQLFRKFNDLTEEPSVGLRFLTRRGHRCPVSYDDVSTKVIVRTFAFRGDPEHLAFPIRPD